MKLSVLATPEHVYHQISIITTITTTTALYHDRREDGPPGNVPPPLAPQQTLLVLGVSPFGDAGTGGESVNRVATDRDC